MCIKIAEGKKKSLNVPRCKIDCILLGDSTFDIYDEVKLCVENEIPIIVVPGSPICDDLVASATGEGGSGKNEITELVDKEHFFYCKSTNS